MDKIIRFHYTEYNSIDDLKLEDRQLLECAINATKNAYAPYSEFKVGAAILLANGVIVTGTNQENAAYPSGLCAERVAMFYASSQYPNIAFKTIAVTANSDKVTIDKPLSPCGSCRQVMVEYETLSKGNIRVILAGTTGKIHIINSTKDLMPFPFVPEDLK